MAPSTNSLCAAAILELAAARAPKTFCPSEVARALARDDWRPLMPAIRESARLLATTGKIVCTQRGEPVDPVAAKGPIRLALRTNPDAGSGRAPLFDRG